MENVIIGTAGHIDHGKTCLIRALSGFDTDRLKEEKKRGITIENGYAHLPNDRGYHLGIIDVPGHEKFVKNMLAGIGGMDIVLLVISLEEGIKQQTIEHFEIIKSLGLKYGVVVFTKLDNVKETNPDFNLDTWTINGHIDTLVNEVKTLCKDSFLENAVMMPVSAYTGENIDKLKELIFANVENLGKRNNNKDETRLPIDRVFTMEGFGTVITGTLMEGQIDVGDELVVYPKNKVVKVRQIESHGKVENTAFAGQRTAINLLNIKKEELDRGDVLATKDSMILSDCIDATLVTFKSVSRKIKNGERVYFNYGSMQTEAIIKIINVEKGGYDNKSCIYVQYKFDSPVPLKRGDKYIIRFISPQITCGGGIVLNIDAKKQKIGDEEALKHFANVDNNDEKVVINEIVSNSSFDFSNMGIYAKKINLCVDDVKKIVEELVNDKKIVLIYENKNNVEKTINDKTVIISDKFYNGIKKYILDVLNKFHKENPILWGMKREELKSLLSKRYVKASDDELQSLLDKMVVEKVLDKKEELIKLAEFKVVIDDKKSQAFTSIENIYKDKKYDIPSVQEVLDAVIAMKKGKKGNVNEINKQTRQMIVDMAKSGVLVKFSNDYYIHKEYYDKAQALLNDYFKKNDKLLLKDWRDILNTSRKYAILILEYFDFKKITKMVGDYRVKL